MNKDFNRFSEFQNDSFDKTFDKTVKAGLVISVLSILFSLAGLGAILYVAWLIAKMAFHQ
jgi:hypothetical protein